MKIAVVGAGLAGLMSAALLKRDGHDVTVFERDSTLEGRGLGLLIQPLGVSVLKHAGLADEVLAAGKRVDSMHQEKLKGVFGSSFYVDYKDLEPGAFGIGIYRPTLFNILLDNARKLGVTFVSGCSIKDAQLKNGQRHIIDEADTDHGAFDLVVDGSGYRSPLRQKYATITREENYNLGFVCGTYEHDASLKTAFNNATASYFKGDKLTIEIPLGKSPVTGKERVSFLWTIPTDKMPANRSAVFDLDAWKKEYLAFRPEMKPYLDQITSQKQLVFAHYSDVVLKDHHAEKIAFIGDSGHSTSPLLAQSTSMGFADAYVLSEALNNNTADLQKALETFSADRKEHIKFQQDNNRLITSVLQSNVAPIRLWRDYGLAAMFRIPAIRKYMAVASARGEQSLKKSVLRNKYGI